MLFGSSPKSTQGEYVEGDPLQRVLVWVNVAVHARIDSLPAALLHKKPASALHGEVEEDKVHGKFTAQAPDGGWRDDSSLTLNKLFSIFPPSSFSSSPPSTAQELPSCIIAVQHSDPTATATERTFQNRKITHMSVSNVLITFISSGISIQTKKKANSLLYNRAVRLLCMQYIQDREQIALITNVYLRRSGVFWVAILASGEVRTWMP